ncbi:hypothetical protein LCGC14_1895210, partial [marine sediment metagenome]
MSPTALVRYTCDICGDTYDTKVEALKCEKRGPLRPKFKVGDIVIGRAGFGWFDGDKR